MDNILKLRCATDDDFVVEFEIEPLTNDSEVIDIRQAEIRRGLSFVEDDISAIEKQIDALDTEINRLTNNSDCLDYTVAVGSGILAGLLDVFFVGELDLQKANALGKEKIENFVIKIAQLDGYAGDNLLNAVRHLEKHKIAADKLTDTFGGALQHHLRDFTHHSSLVGLFFSIFTQFTGKVYGTDTAGNFISSAYNADEKLIGANIYEKFTTGVTDWFFHLVSDMAGSSSSIADGKSGTGIPGPILSLAKEISALPIFQQKNIQTPNEFSKILSKIFNGTFFGSASNPIKFDLRTEIGLLPQIGKQSIPIVINECVVRLFYLLRKLKGELEEKDIRRFEDFGKIDWKKTLPFKNRTLARMLTISTGTMTAIDMAEAAITSYKKSAGNSYAFAANMLLKVNYAGIGRFAVAVYSDTKMGMQRCRARNERIKAYSTLVSLYGLKMSYKQADTWIVISETAEAQADMWESAKVTELRIREAYDVAQKSANYCFESWKGVDSCVQKICGYLPDVKSTNPGLTDELADIMEYGG